MKRLFCKISTACLLAWLLSASVSMAQQPRRDAYFADPAVAATVSPYLNLGVNANGVSNYQSLVRPLLDQRAALTRQTMATDRIHHQPGLSQGDNSGYGTPREDRRSGHAARRFMNYSHYFVPGS